MRRQSQSPIPTGGNSASAAAVYTANSGSSHPLPRYSSLSLVPLPTYPTAAELDVSSPDDPINSDSDRFNLGSASSSSRSKETFEFCLDTTSSTVPKYPWAILRLKSVVPRSLQRPRYTTGENVEGSVVLDLKRPQTIHSVVVLMRGRMITSSLSDGSQLFLEVTHTLWKSGSPEAEGVAHPSTGKLQGRYEWPFSFPFPTEFQDPGGRGKPQGQDDTELFATPQTVLERGINANLMYEVVVKITSGFFHTKHRVDATVLYVPVIRPPPLPVLRSYAYETGSSLVPPSEDPDGWVALPPMEFRVSETGRPPSHIKCTIHIARSVVYTRGTVIPCYLTCEPAPSSTENTHNEGYLLSFIHSLTSQSYFTLKLLQRVAYPQDVKHQLSNITREMAKARRSLEYPADSEELDGAKEVGTAVWWIPTSTNMSAMSRSKSSSPSRPLEGEIHLDSGLLPSTDLPFLGISYHIKPALHAPSTDLSVIYLSDRPHELPSCSVQIVTAHYQQGPIPTPFTPRPAPKKKDLSTVQDVPYHIMRSGHDSRG